MAKVSFFTADGEKTYSLNKYRGLQIGRDPGNDVVLRDARVSRHHAEIVFEKGFFVVRDLSSANGSYVNGKKIRVAPLTDRSELKFGNTAGSFFDDMPTETEAPTPTVAVDLRKTTARDRGFDEMGGSLDTNPRLLLVVPPPPSSPTTMSQDLVVFPEVGEFVPEPLHSSSPPSQSTEDLFRQGLYVLDVSVPYGEQSTVRDEDGEPLFYYRRPVNLVGFVAGLVAGFIFLAGLASTIFLTIDRRIIPAALALVLTAVFFTIVLLLVPRRHIYLYKDESMTSVALMLWQETRLSFPILRFTARAPDGTMIGCFTKSAFSSLGRHRWAIFDRMGVARIGHAVEDSFWRAMVRKVLGSFFGMLRTNFLLFMNGQQVGVIDRRTTPLDRYFLDLRGEGGEQVDRRVALALAVLIDGLERK